jgi:hypothetical protein
MPTRLPKRAVLPSALVLSLVAHALVAGLAFKAWHDTRPAASVGRQKGALQVTLRRDATPPAKATTPPTERSSTSATPRKQRARVERPAAAPKPAPSPGPSPAPAAAAVTAAPPPAEQPGARFANLFAPIVHAPMGQGRWTSRRANAPAPVPPEQQRDQALTALRAALSARFASLGEQVRAAQAQIACDLVVDIERRIGQIDCEDGQQQALAWGHLQGTLAAGLVSNAAQRLCLRLSGQQVQDTTCAAPATP